MEQWIPTRSKATVALHYGAPSNVTNQHPVATAILIHQDCGIHLRRAESRSRVLLAVLEVPSASAAAPSQLIYLANVHLDAGAGPEHGPGPNLGFDVRPGLSRQKRRDESGRRL